MDLADVEMFLSIVSTKSISKTAEALFLSAHGEPPAEAAGKGAQLFPGPAQGFKQIELTGRHGFYSHRRADDGPLEGDAAAQGRRERTLLTIGCTDSMNVALLAPSTGS